MSGFHSQLPLHSSTQTWGQAVPRGGSLGHCFRNNANCTFPFVFVAELSHMRSSPSEYVGNALITYFWYDCPLFWRHPRQTALLPAHSLSHASGRRCGSSGKVARSTRPGPVQAHPAFPHPGPWPFLPSPLFWYSNLSIVKADCTPPVTCTHFSPFFLSSVHHFGYFLLTSISQLMLFFAISCLLLNTSREVLISNIFVLLHCPFNFYKIRFQFSAKIIYFFIFYLHFPLFSWTYWSEVLKVP